MGNKDTEKRKKVKVHHTMRINPDLLKRIKSQATKEGRPVNNMIERVLDLNIQP